MESSFLADIHTKVVHFPVALLATYSVIEIIGIIFRKEFLSKTALLILCIGVVTAFFAVLTGNQAAANFAYWNYKSSSLLSQHQNYATYLLWFSVCACAFRLYLIIKKRFAGYLKYSFILIASVILFLVIQTGLHGGDLVKKFGVGTDLYKIIETK